MTELVAKPIVKNQFWIVTDGHKKVGNIEANNAGYGVQLNGTFLQFNNADELKKSTKIRFESIANTISKPTHPYPEYPTTKRVYNSILDIQRGLHLFTKTKKSKCYHAAGYFVIDQNGTKQVSFCPKYIFVQRYPYQGPFKTESEAEGVINTLIMLHIKKFMDKMSVVESKMNKDVVLSIMDARGLRDDITRLLADLHELSSSTEKNEVIEVQIKGGSF